MVPRVGVGRRCLTWCVVLAMSCAWGACASRQTNGLTDTFVQKGDPAMEIGDPDDVNADLYDPDAEPPPLEDLEVQRPTVLAQVATTLEDSDQDLATALVAAAARPSPEAHRRVAKLYEAHGIMDMAFDHLIAAEELAPDDPATQDSLARLWRSWGFGEIGLGAAYRAVYKAPESAEAANTLGTVLQEVGHLDEARRAYQRSLELDPTAAYVLNNLCYLAYTEGAFGEAADRCQAAIALDPDLSAAHNNLALVYLSTGQDDLAWRSLQDAGPIWTAMYNLGLAHMARGNHLAAAAAFSATSKANPHWAAPRNRAKQALEQSTTEPEVR